jgi:O-antigen/teichoic acid export membrane protein
MVGSLINSFTSLFFMIIVTRVNGVDTAGVFTFSFSLACLFSVIANYSGRTFQVTNTDKKLLDSDFLYQRFFSSALMVICTLVYLFIKNYSITKMIVIFLFVIFRLFEAVSDVLYGVIQKNEELYKVGISLFLKWIIGTLVFLFIDLITKNIIYSISGLIVVNVLIFIFYDWRNCKRNYERGSYCKKNIWIIFKTGFFVFGFTFLTQYILNAPKYAIDDFMSNSAQTIYGIIVMPATILILCSQFIIQPLLMVITSMVEEKKYSKLKSITLKIVLAIIIIGFIGEFCCYFLGIPFLELIYSVSLKKYLLPLMIIICGATFYGISFVFSTVLTALRKTFIQIIFYAIVSIFAFVLSRFLVLNYGILGASVSYCLSMLVLCFIYFGYFLIYIKNQKNDNRSLIC